VSTDTEVAALRASEARLHEAQRLAGLGSWTFDIPSKRFTASPTLASIFGIDLGSLANGIDSYMEIVHPDDRAAVGAALSAAMDARIRSAETEFRIVRPDGTVRWIASRAEWTFTPDGRPLMGTGTLQDLTDRRVLEQQLRQAQKLEAVGRLAGGIAHDFNNLLTVMTSYTDLALSQLAPDQTLYSDLLEIRRAAERAAALTRQLLAFSKKQVTTPTVVDPNTVIRHAENMLRRLVGESVTLRTDLRSLSTSFVDAGQLEQVLLNLAVNARDAMPTGGTVTVATRDVDVVDKSIAVRPGRYIMISVIDEGSGMTEETRARLFEPFFTTKEPGRGTGLGLPTVYGIVTQAGGDIRVTTDLGKGSRFDVYLPSTAQLRATAARSRRERPPSSETRGTVLLAEDEDAVRRLVVRALETAGFVVLPAADGQAALELAASYEGEIDIVVTDVVMPRLGGAALVDELRRTRPRVSALLMSGYAGDAELRESVERGEAPFLEKPFGADDVVRAVRRVLDLREASGGKRV